MKKKFLFLLFAQGVVAGLYEDLTRERDSLIQLTVTFSFVRKRLEDMTAFLHWIEKRKALEERANKLPAESIPKEGAYKKLCEMVPCKKTLQEVQADRLRITHDKFLLHCTEHVDMLERYLTGDLQRLIDNLPFVKEKNTKEAFHSLLEAINNKRPLLLLHIERATYFLDAYQEDYYNGPFFTLKNTAIQWDFEWGKASPACQRLFDTAEQEITLLEEKASYIFMDEDDKIKSVLDRLVEGKNFLEEDRESLIRFQNIAPAFYEESRRYQLRINTEIKKIEKYMRALSAINSAFKPLYAEDKKKGDLFWLAFYGKKDKNAWEESEGRFNALRDEILTNDFIRKARKTLVEGIAVVESAEDCQEKVFRFLEDNAPESFWK